MNTIDAILLLGISYIPILTAVYVLIIALLIKNRNSYPSHAFAWLMILCGIVDCALIVCTFIVHRLPALSFTSAHFRPVTTPIRLTMSTTYSLTCIHDLLTLLITIDRQSAITNSTFTSCCRSRFACISIVSSVVLTLLVFASSYATPLIAFQPPHPMNGSLILVHTNTNNFSAENMLPPPFMLAVLSAVCTSAYSLIVTDRTMSDVDMDEPGRGLEGLVQRHYLESRLRLVRHANGILLSNLFYALIQLLNLRSGLDIHIPAGLYLNGVAIDLKVYAPLLIFITDDTTASPFHMIRGYCRDHDRFESDDGGDTEGVDDKH